MKKTSFFRTIIPVILILTLIFTIACDNKNNDNIETGDGLTIPAVVSRNDAMSIINRVGSGDMMYKFSYLKPEDDEVSYTNDIFSETWDRRLFLSVGDDFN